jgi:hypothetical protein
MNRREQIKELEFALARANAVAAKDDERTAAEWAAARNPFEAWRNHMAPHNRALRLAAMEPVFAARDKLYTLRASKGVLNTAGRQQATLERATTNNIVINPAKTVEQRATDAVRQSHFERPVKASKKVAV